MFKQLSETYPHPDNGVYFNFRFCVFELDALVMLGGKVIAVELAGSHYAHKNSEGQVGDSLQGKKQIKSRIVQAYGIRQVEINSVGLVERTISSFQNSTHAAKYLRLKLEAVLLTP